MQHRGFTLIELLIVTAVLIIILAISIPSINSLIKNPQVTNTAEEIINAIKLAQNKTLSSEANSQYGVYFETTTNPHRYILFKGSSYALRDSNFDQAYQIPSATEFNAIDFSGGNEVVFNKITGITQNPGDITIRLKDDYSQAKTIYVDSFGVTSFNAPLAPSDALRVKDSRHIVFSYNRFIDTTTENTENIILTFNGSTVVTIPISSFLNNGQFGWSGVTSAGGSDQTITIHTLRLNGPDTQFSIFRDMRFNDTTLTVEILEDITGTLAEYSADGLTTNFSSIYVNNFAWQ